MIAEKFRIVSRTLILILGLIVFSIAFISGIDDFRRGIDDMVMSSPYLVAWIIILIILFVAWVWELAGGITIFIMSLYSLYFFMIHDSNYSFEIIIFTIALLILSLSLLAAWYFDGKAVDE